MRRADRLFQIILHLRRNRLATTARVLAQALEVSERTIYRDINELSRCGIPVEGEPGIGYRLRYNYDLPPLMFDRDELEALRLGARMVHTWADPDLARAARYALNKIETALPETMQHRESPLYAPRFYAYPLQTMGLIRHAVSQQRKVSFAYQRKDETRSQRTVRPLGLFYWGRVWTLVAWCELRDDFRHFRLDRISDAVIKDETFSDTPGRTLNDFFRHIGHSTGA